MNSGNILKILLVDDQRLTEILLKRILNTADGGGMVLYYEQNPSDAEVKARTINPEVILLDLVMPEMDGLVLLERLRNHEFTKDIPIIMLSAVEDPHQKAAAFALGASDYVIKFPDPVEMLARLRHHGNARSLQIRQHQAEIELKQQRDRLEETLVELKLRENELKSIFNAALDAIIMMDQEGKVIGFNPAAEKLFGYDRDEVIGRELADLIIPPQFRRQHRIAIEQHANKSNDINGMTRRLDVQALRASGDVISLEIAITAVKSHGRLIYTGFMHDVTERKQLVKSLGDALVAAEVANRSKGEFLATMSHEIRTPMNVVLGMSDVLLETSLDIEQRQIVETMHRSGKALMSVINDVLDFSRIESGRFTVSNLPFSPRQVVEEIVCLMRMTAEGKGLTLTEESSPNIPEAILGDDGRVRQVLINLLGNAIKFTRQGQVFVRLSCYSEVAETLLFSVSDTGIGIAPEHTDHIFKHFTQADSGIARHFGGTGLGLAISKKLVELMGGRIWVESRLGQGSTFHFTLPARLVPATALVTAPIKTASTSGRSLHILVAEDAPENQMLIHAYLKKTPHCVVMVNDGVEAVARVKEESFDLVLMDIQMPNMDGYAATRAIRQWELEEQRQPLTIMALSAHASSSKREESLAAGCDGHLTKPIKKQTLLDAIQRVAESISEQDLVAAVRHIPQGVPL
ncbi:MAG: response regulator [Magnetococcales bacterium]|nr:response regulator [Magnetococcales bacterium]